METGPNSLSNKAGLKQIPAAGPRGPRLVRWELEEAGQVGVDTHTPQLNHSNTMLCLN